MLIYRDIISGDELCSDSYPMTEVDDIVYEFDGKSIIIRNGIPDSAIGGNKAEAEENEEVDDQTETQINIVYAHRLAETAFTKKDFTKSIKDYLKRIVQHLEQNNPERVPIFKEKAQKYVMQVIKKFEEYRIYTGETMDPDSMMVLCNYREDQITPYFVFFKDGLKEEKF